MANQEPHNSRISTECRNAQSELGELHCGGALERTRETALLVHLSECDTCASFDRIMRNLGELPPVSNEMIRLRTVRAARIAYFEHRKPRLALLRWGAVAVAAMMIAVLLPVLFSSNDDTHTGNVQQLVAGQRLSLMDDRVTFFSSAETKLGSVLTSPNTMHIQLDSGFVCANIEPHPEHKVHFRVITPLGNVDIRGTVFAVTVFDDDVRVDVVRGEVAVVPDGASNVFSVRAGSVFHMKTRRTQSLDDASQMRIRSFLGMPQRKSLIPSADVSEMPSTVNPTGSLDSDDSEDAAAPVPPRFRIVPTLPHPSLKKLLDEATECRIIRDWRCAAKAYGGIIKHFPGRAEAATAMVSLGQIQLDHLHKPHKARQNFVRYEKTRPSGPLSEQALQGIARTSRVLGDVGREKEALKQFITQYPSSPAVELARQRLNELQKK
jgi:ferric-dicitrate binding protein FerR (iron transport regulator)